MREPATDTDLNLLGEFEAVRGQIENERVPRLLAGSKLLQFGVSFLDEAFGGIEPNDLITLGSKTGQGKTQLAMHIALANIRSGKRVHFFSLEAERFEIGRRLKYQLIADAFFADHYRPAVNLNYLDWKLGRLDHDLARYEEEIEHGGERFEGMKVFYRTSSFGAKDFERLFLAIKLQTDLVIVDHLHYFDHEDDNENRAVKHTVKTIMDAVQIAGVPVILIAHVRKGDRKSGQLIPDIEDFHGSSDIGKIATKSLAIAAGPYLPDKRMRMTYFKTQKCRTDGSRAPQVACLGYSLDQQRYERAYTYMREDQFGSELHAILTDSDIPTWAKSANRASQIDVKGILS